MSLFLWHWSNFSVSLSLSLCSHNTTLFFFPTPQVYFYSFDVFHAAGIQEDQLSYAALGTGLCELITSFACVSPGSLTSHHVSFQFYGPSVSVNAWCAVFNAL